MNKRLSYLILLVMGMMLGNSAMAQQPTVKGKVINSSKESVGAVSIVVKGTNIGTYSSDKGEFSVKIPAFPATLIFSSIGFEDKEVEVSSAFIGEVELKSKAVLGQEVVVSATRVATRQLESPVTIERMSSAFIRETPAVTFYDAIGNLKGVDVMSSSLTFKTIGTRGFNGSGNLRLNQLIDGMDNQAPGLNFAVGNVIGIPELDVDNVELLPGASSALYGSGGMNGTVLINSKNPFKYQGLSFQVRGGMMNLGTGTPAPSSPYWDFQARWAKKISDKLAVKIGAQLIQAQDWQATDQSNYNVNRLSIVPGDRNLPGYDGVNIYGDEINTNMKSALRGSIFSQAYAQILPIVRQNIYNAAYAQAIGLGQTPAQADAFANATANAQAPAIATAQANSVTASNVGSLFATNSDSIVSRTGFREADLVNYNTYNLKMSGGIYYKLTNDIEVSLSGFHGLGSTVYTGQGRYSLKDIIMGQYKAEMKGKNFYLRWYTTQENSGDSYNATALGAFMNQAISNSAGAWYPTYINAWAGARQGALPGQGGVPASEDLAHVLARRAADASRPAVGSATFNSIKDEITSTPIGKLSKNGYGGARFLDRSDLYVTEGMYNFADKIKFAEVIVGASWKRYVLNSKGTLFVDTLGKAIKVNEYGGFIQVQKKFFDDVLKLTLAGRYDKHDNFEGRFTPRVTAMFKLTKEQNLRLSYQSAYRFPSTQNQYINLNTGTSTLIGGLPGFSDYYGFNSNPVYDTSELGKLSRGQITPAQLKPFKAGEFKPESVNSYEIGYKALFANKLQIDAYYFYAVYQDFIGLAAVVQNPGMANQRAFGVSFTSNTSVKAQGAGLGIDYLMPSNFVFSGNVSYAELTEVPSGLVTFFNTPKWRYNVTLSNNKVCKNYGFNVTYRWQSEHFYESSFVTGTVPAFGTLDAQVSFKIPNTKNILKLGANNLLNEYYQSGFANPQIGGMYYLSFGFNVY
jgi:outer membrane receptor protein involved in Fe transport